uniref:Ataxin 7 n=1 Tax=Loxodonta africana TaxID=9785 RepID=G3UMU6_LOXAF
DDREESVEKLDCHYSGRHPQPASFCTFGSRQIGRGYYVFDSRWNRLRCALSFLVEKHLNAQLWRRRHCTQRAAGPVLPLELGCFSKVLPESFWGLAEVQSLMKLVWGRDTELSVSKASERLEPGEQGCTPEEGLEASASTCSDSFLDTWFFRSICRAAQQPFRPTPSSQRKIPPVPSTTSPVSTRAPHRANAVPTPQYGASSLAASVCPSPVLPSPACVSPTGKSVPAHGTTLNAQPAASGAVDPVCSAQSRHVCPSSSSPSTPSGLSSVPSSPMSRKPQKLKASKSVRPRESPGNSTNCHGTGSSNSGGSGKKRKSGSPLLAPPFSSCSSSSHSMESFRKNCVAHAGPPLPSVVTSSHSMGLSCVMSRANSVSIRHEPSGRGPPSGSPAESIKRMSVVVNSSDSTLSLGPFVHQSSELAASAHSRSSHSHTPLDQLTGKKRKCPSGSSSVSTNSSKPTKVSKLPAVNNIHMKH